METAWFIIVGLMLTLYVILDGFDLGAGILFFRIGRTQKERRLILRTIGPVWDGNEVWLLAAGGTLFFSFPVLYAASFSGFYLPLMMVLWCLILRGLGVELRGHVNHPMWHSFWDLVFSTASILLAIFFGAAAGNVIRGVPLDAEHFFFEPLWTNFLPEGQTGILDWYTVLTGVVALIALAVHGAHYIAVKTEGELQLRARLIARRYVLLLALITAVSFAATLSIRPELIANYSTAMWGAIFPLTVVISLGAMIYFNRKQRDAAAFFSSAFYFAGMLGGAAFAMYPNVLPATTSPEFGLTIYNSSASPYGMRVGFIWWTIGATLAAIYFTFIYRLFRGKVSLEGEGY